MKQYIKRVAVVVGAFLLPAVAFAQYTINNSDDLFNAVRSILDEVIPIIVALAVIYVIFGIVETFTRNDEEKRGQAKTHVIYGIIGLFVIVSIWGLVNILTGTARLTNTVPNTIPLVNQIETAQ